MILKLFWSPVSSYYTLQKFKRNRTLSYLILIVIICSVDYGHKNEIYIISNSV